VFFERPTQTEQVSGTELWNRPGGEMKGWMAVGEGVKQRGKESIVWNTEHTRGCGTRSLQGSVVADHTGNSGLGIVSPWRRDFTQLGLPSPERQLISGYQWSVPFLLQIFVAKKSDYNLNLRNSSQLIGWSIDFVFQCT
jgi:hypothetical protein